jgi:hypothetical protein
MYRVAASDALLTCIAMSIAFAAHAQASEQPAAGGSQYLVTPNGCKFLRPGGNGDPPQVMWAGDCVDGFVSGKGDLTVKGAGEAVFSGDFEKGEIKRGSVESKDAIYKGEFKNNVADGQGELSYRSRTWSVKGTFKDGKPLGNVFELTLPNGRYVGEVNVKSWTAEGKGTYYYRDGSVYEGTLLNDLPHGPGEARMASGEVRKGTFVNGHAEGKGSLHWSDGTSYEGELRLDQPQGLGKYNYANGTMYEGEFVAGDAHGKGKMTWPNGNAFEGDFLYGKPHGKGTYHFDGNAIYKGDMVSGEFHGEGRATSEAGTVKEGQWKQGKLHGKCHQSYPDGERFDGLCADDLYSGHGHLERAASGEVYDGEFRSGEYDGKGVLRVGGYKFEGTFNQGMKEGSGKETDESGGEYEGNYSQNLWHGSGTLKARDEDGTLVVYEGQFEKGAMHGTGKMAIGSRTLEGEFRNNEFAKGIVSEGANRFEVDLQLGIVMQIMPDGSRRSIDKNQGI